MPKSYAQLQQSLTFDHLMKTLDERFQTIPGNRTGNAVRYQLPDILKAAFAMFSLKSPSLLDFKTQTTAEEKNLHNIYRIEGEIPCDNQMRGIFDPEDGMEKNDSERNAAKRLCKALNARYPDLKVIVKVKLWASIRHLFSTLVFKSMEAIYRRMASLYRLQLE